MPVLPPIGRWISIRSCNKPGVSVLQLDSAVSFRVKRLFPAEDVIFCAPLLQVVDDDGRRGQDVRDFKTLLLAVDLSVAAEGHPFEHHLTPLV